MSLLQACMGSERGKRLLLECQFDTGSATWSNDEIRHVFMDAMTDCSTAPLPLRKCSAFHSQYSLITNPEMELKQINFMAFKRTFIQSEVEQLYIRNKTTRTTQNDVHKRPQLQQPIARQQTSMHEHCRTTYLQKTASTVRCNCKGNRFPLVRHQGVLHAPMLSETKTLHPTIHSAKQWHIRDCAHTIMQKTNVPIYLCKYCINDKAEIKNSHLITKQG